MARSCDHDVCYQKRLRIFSWSRRLDLSRPAQADHTQTFEFRAMPMDDHSFPVSSPFTLNDQSFAMNMHVCIPFNQKDGEDIDILEATIYLAHGWWSNYELVKLQPTSRFFPFVKAPRLGVYPKYTLLDYSISRIFVWIAIVYTILIRVNGFANLFMYFTPEHCLTILLIKERSHWSLWGAIEKKSKSYKFSQKIKKRLVSFSAHSHTS